MRSLPRDVHRGGEPARKLHGRPGPGGRLHRGAVMQLLCECGPLPLHDEWRGERPAAAPVLVQHIRQEQLQEVDGAVFPVRRYPVSMVLLAADDLPPVHGQVRLLRSAP